VVDCAVKVLRNEGVLAFWTGLGAYYMRTAPHAMIVLLTQEPLAAFYKKTLYH
jgi:solute carrier family 25 (mitochondrial oxoglutarate transporter), member 11